MGLIFKKENEKYLFISLFLLLFIVLIIQKLQEIKYAVSDLQYSTEGAKSSTLEKKVFDYSAFLQKEFEQRLQKASAQKKYGSYFKNLAEKVSKLADHHHVPVFLILAVIKIESNFHPHAISDKGAMGLMQVMPQTAIWILHQQGRSRPELIHEWLLNPENNLEMGIWYLSYLLKKYSGDFKKTLLAYNHGPARLDQAQSKGISLKKDYYLKVRQVFSEYRLKALL